MSLLKARRSRAVAGVAALLAVTALSACGSGATRTVTRTETVIRTVTSTQSSVTTSASAPATTPVPGNQGLAVARQLATRCEKAPPATYAAFPTATVSKQVALQLLPRVSVIDDSVIYVFAKPQTKRSGFEAVLSPLAGRVTEIMQLLQQALAPSSKVSASQLREDLAAADALAVQDGLRACALTL